MDCSHIVISVKPKYAAQMLSGQKTVELRRRTVHVEPGDRVWIYTTVPEARIAAVATIVRVCTDQPEKIWRRYKGAVGISSEEFDRYFSGSEQACAIVLDNVQAVVPALHLAELRKCAKRFHPPQFFKRLREGSVELDLLKSVDA